MATAERLRIVQYGLGPIGLATVRAILGRRDVELVGAIDIDRQKIGRDVADLADLKRPSGIRVSNRPDELLAITRPGLVVHTTGSRLPEVLPQLRACLEVGSSVVSSCEELLFPSVRHPELARELDALARSKGAAVLGTGVNPGFVMDTIALVASAPCLELRHLRIERVVDAATRRLPLQKKIGGGMTPAQFRRGVAKGELGHVGLRESLHLVASGLGWELDRVEEKVAPVVARKSVRTRFITVKAGQVAGIRHTCRGYWDDGEILSLDLQMFVGARAPYDRITVKGTPPLTLEFRGGVSGDEATVGMLLSMGRLLTSASPGLKTMMDLPLPRFHVAS